MHFKDYYAALGVARTATRDEIKRAFRKLARKYHPDVSKEPDAEARFKDVAEAHEALIDPERRAAYDEVARRHADGPSFEPPPGWDSGYEFSGGDPETDGRNDAFGRRHGGGMGNQQDHVDPRDFSAFFEALFGRASRGARSGAAARNGGGNARQHAESGMPRESGDHHAKVTIDLKDAFMGAKRMIVLRMPVADAEGQVSLQERRLEVSIPAGVRAGQHLRLTGS